MNPRLYFPAVPGDTLTFDQTFRAQRRDFFYLNSGLVC
jgi:hypothetical protein